MFGLCLNFLDAVFGRIFCSDDASGIFLLPRITLFIPVRSKNQESVEHALSHWKNKCHHMCHLPAYLCYQSLAASSQWMCLKRAPWGTWIPWKTGGCGSALWQVLGILLYTRNPGGLQEPGKNVSEKSLVSCDALGSLLLAPRAKVSQALSMLCHAVRTRDTWWCVPTAVQSLIRMQHQRRLLWNAGFNQWPLWDKRSCKKSDQSPESPSRR